MPRCSSCQAPIEWATSEATGKALPIDAQAVADGNIVLRDGHAVVLGKDAIAALPKDVPRFKSHFATCPHHRQWRKPKETPVASPLPPGDDGIRYVVERPKWRRGRGGVRKVALVASSRRVEDVRHHLRPGDVLARVRIDECGRELEREVMSWRH